MQSANCSATPRNLPLMQDVKVWKGHEVRIHNSDFNDGFQISVVNICPCN
jgi:hypothetical protein